jgi:V/A-type H+/Na+-transporting ATPase subunit E
MSVPPPTLSSANRLADAVLAQANEEADRIRQAATAEASRSIAEAEAEAAARREAAAKMRDAEALRSQVAARALSRLEARRELLEAREKLIERVFARSAEALESLRTHHEYASVLSRLVREAVDALGEKSFIVEVAPEDLPVAEHVTASIATPELTIEPRARDGLRGGCIVWRGDRRAFCDNTFIAVLSRNRPRLRALVAECLWGDSAGVDGESGRASSE